MSSYQWLLFPSPTYPQKKSLARITPFLVSHETKVTREMGECGEEWGVANTSNNGQGRLSRSAGFYDLNAAYAGTGLLLKVTLPHKRPPK